MSIKSTQYITRSSAITRISDAIKKLSNEALGNIMDDLGDLDECRDVSLFENFIVEGEDECPTCGCTRS